MLVSDFVEVEGPKVRQDVQPQDRLVGLPTPLVIHDVWEVALLNELR